MKAELKILVVFCEGGWIFSGGAAGRYPGGGWTNSRETRPASGIQLAQFPSNFNEKGLDWYANNLLTAVG